MSIAVMKQALEALEDPWKTGPDGVANAITALRAAIEQADKYQRNNPLGGPAKVFDAMADAIRAGDDYHATLRSFGFVERTKGYDQTSLELCEECGWRAMIPGDGCLVCARQKAKPVAWVYPEFWDHLKQVNCGTAYRSPDDGMQPLYTAPRQWVGLTDEEIEDEWERVTGHSIFGGDRSAGRSMFLSPDEVIHYTQAIETKLKEKNA